jgi:hypothetical protein
MSVPVEYLEFMYATEPVQLVGSTTIGTYTIGIPFNANEGSDPFGDFAQYSEPNWDGEGAAPILPQTIARARELVKAMREGWKRAEPEVFPGVDGAVGLTWGESSAVVHALALPDGRLQILYSSEVYPDFERVFSAQTPAHTAIQSMRELAVPNVLPFAAPPELPKISPSSSSFYM